MRSSTVPGQNFKLATYAQPVRSTNLLIKFALLFGASLLTNVKECSDEKRSKTFYRAGEPDR